MRLCSNSWGDIVSIVTRILENLETQGKGFNALIKLTKKPTMVLVLALIGLIINQIAVMKYKMYQNVCFLKCL